MSDLKNLPHLIDLAHRALAVDTCETALKASKSCLSASYATWKAEHGLERVERDSPEWSAMLVATEPHYTALQLARRAAYNAKRGFANAVRRYRKIEVQEAQ